MMYRHSWLSISYPIVVIVVVVSIVVVSVVVIVVVVDTDARLFGDSATPDAWGVTRSQDVPVSEGEGLRPVLEKLDKDQQRVVESLLAQSAQAVRSSSCCCICLMIAFALFLFFCFCFFGLWLMAYRLWLTNEYDLMMNPFCVNRFQL